RGLTMTDTPNGYRALPWYSDGYRVYDADGIEVANTFTPELALGSAKAVAKDIAEAANAHYVGKDRIADLERKLKRAHDTMADLHRDWTWEEARAKKAEADLSYYKTASKNFEDSYWEANKRAEAAEARLKEVDSDRWGLLNRAEDAEARAKELEQQLFDMEGRRTARELGLKKRAEKAEARVRELETAELVDAMTVDAPESFTAPDGRVFRVGQRVQDVCTDEIGVVDGFNPLSDRRIVVRLGGLMSKYDFDLRRVWDNWDDSDIPTGTVLRDANGNSWFVGGFGLLLRTGQKFIWSSEEPVAPFVEALPEDDE